MAIAACFVFQREISRSVFWDFFDSIGQFRTLLARRYRIIAIGCSFRVAPLKRNPGHNMTADSVKPSQGISHPVASAIASACRSKSAISSNRSLARSGHNVRPPEWFGTSTAFDLLQAVVMA
jgi:hypothetical protein